MPALFAPTAGEAALYTTLVNEAVKELHFGFIPPHGRTLAAAEEITVFGDFSSWFAKLNPDGRSRRSFAKALDNDVLAIKKGPSVHLSDATTGQTKVLTALDVASVAISNVALTTNVATITTAANHNLVVGQVVVVDASNNTFDGTFTVTSVPTATTFTYNKTAANVGAVAATGTVTSGRLGLVDPSWGAYDAP